MRKKQNQRLKYKPIKSYRWGVCMQLASIINQSSLSIKQVENIIKDVLASDELNQK